MKWDWFLLRVEWRRWNYFIESLKVFHHFCIESWRKKRRFVFLRSTQKAGLLCRIFCILLFKLYKIISFFENMASLWSLIFCFQMLRSPTHADFWCIYFDLSSKMENWSFESLKKGEMYSFWEWWLSIIGKIWYAIKVIKDKTTYTIITPKFCTIRQRWLAFRAFLIMECFFYLFSRW